jgi:hypothetical protein
VVALGSASLLLAADKGPDAGNYTANDGAVYSFEDLVAGGSAASVLRGSDDDVALLTLPFPFQFYGRSYTMVCASSNGLLTFVTAASGCIKRVDFANTDLSNTAPPGDLPTVAPFWTDLRFDVAGSDAVYYKVNGAAGSRRFIIEWANAFPGTSANPVTFEVVLYEGLNKILAQYQTVDLGSGNQASKGGTATVGIRDSAGQTNRKQILWSFDAAVLGNGTAVQFTPPLSAQQSVNTITTSPAGLAVTVDGVQCTTPKVVSWTPNSSHTLAVTQQQVTGGTRTTFTGWSPGGATASINVTAGATGTTYTASFTVEYQLTTAVNPAGAGTISPGGWFINGNSATVQATANSGYTFANFSGSASGNTNPTNVAMNAPKNIVANFSATSGVVNLAAAISGKADGTGGQRLWTLRLTNTGNAPANNAQITGLTLTQTAGTLCSPAASVITATPVNYGTIAAGTNTTQQVTLALGGCDTTARFSLVVRFAANGGAYAGSSTLANQTR